MVTCVVNNTRNKTVFYLLSFCEFGRDRMGASATITLPAEPAIAFDTFVEELRSALTVRGIRFETGPNGGLVESGRQIADVTSWQPGAEILLQWHQPEWKKEVTPNLVEFRFEPIERGTHLTLTYDRWENLFDDLGNELAGWFAGQVAAPLLQSMTPVRFEDWIIDRAARRPSGAKARTTYRNPVYHKPNFLAILDILQLRPSDYLLEVGCGGGAFLKDALRSDCKAEAIDHSREMVHLARDVNHADIREGRLDIVEAEADRLPYSDAIFTCAVMTGVFSFLQNPVGALREIYRVLVKGGRLVVFTGSKELRGTPAAPELIASRLSFYEDNELLELAHEAGFGIERVERPNLESFARQADVPLEHQHLFS